MSIGEGEEIYLQVVQQLIDVSAPTCALLSEQNWVLLRPLLLL